jgi:hypothetical protein
MLQRTRLLDSAFDNSLWMDFYVFGILLSN